MIYFSTRDINTHVANIIAIAGLVLFTPSLARGRDNGSKTRSGAKPLNRGDVALNLLALTGTLAL